MNRPGRAARLFLAFAVALLLSGGVLSTPTRAAAPDRSEVVLVLDFSASILKDKANRDQFASALESMADRVTATSADLVAGDTTASIVQFASKAADYPGCADLHLLDSPAKVATFAGCLRSVAGAYRKGLDPALSKKIGIDTNYVAAMEQAAKHLPKVAVRPAVILFTDGKHDVNGVPVSQVQPTRDRLFGSRTPFALLPVGMGLDPKEKGALTAGLQKLRITRDMPPCVSGATFDWPQVVFDTPAQAGNAVAVALQDATCTFTVAPTPEPTAEPTPAAPAIPAIRGIAVTPGDGQVQVTWAPFAAGATGVDKIIDYHVRCRPSDGGDWIMSTEGASLASARVVTGLTSGTAYQCEVAPVTAAGEGPFTPATGTVTPIGKPAPPEKPSVEALNGAVLVRLAAAPGATSTHVECSPDGGATWPSVIDVAGGADPNVQLPGLANGTEYVCRAIAVNAVGQSDPSPVSDIARPCSSALDCNPVLAPVLGVLGLALLIGAALVIFALVRSRPRGYVLAVVDVVHTANLGYGSTIGIGFVRDPVTKRVTEVVSDKGKTAEVRIRHTKNGFIVRDRHGR
ncbi:MAG: fibronectin type III domain-containing protein, partial [Chloroflexota bacterium]